MTLPENSARTIERVAAIPLPHEAKAVHGHAVGLLIPPSVFVVPRGWEWTHTAPFEGPSILSSLVKGLGYPFRMIDQRDDFDAEHVRGLAADCDIVGVSVYGDSFNYVRRAVEVLKAERPQRPVVLGGPLATSVPRLLLETTRADFVVAGEGELTFTELLDRLAGSELALPVSKILGLAWKDESGAARLNAPRPQLRDLDVVPFQDLRAWDRFRGKPIPELYLSYSRGCPHSCTFCYRAFPKLRRKSVERVKREMDYYAPCGFRYAWWNDLTFVTDRDYLRRLMDTAIKGHRFRWNAFSRVTGLDEETLLLMKKNGLDIILYGMESVSPAVLARYRKGTSKNAMVEVIRLHRECGVKVGGLFIVGAPEDDRQGMRDLVEFCKEFKEVTRVKYLSALPGTPFYRECLKNGVIPDERKHLEWLSEEQSIEEDIDHPGFVKFTEHLTKAELRQVYHDVNGLIESRPYDHSREDNVFLEAGEKFIKRKPASQ
ncbi:MAG: radical SAM protein [Elusimicrobia bacterium]|nr:radical SAM protein [Elusimicrobiota bacterium]